MPTQATCAREIESLHQFFVEWYAGTRNRDDFERLERVLAPGFEMITPDGDRLDRTAILERIRTDYGRDEPGSFDIDIRNVIAVASTTDHTLCRYEEHQTTPDGDTARISTAYFRSNPSTPMGVEWLALHETWL